MSKVNDTDENPSHIMERLLSEASSPKRIATLKRFQTAVDDIMSGKAFALAREEGLETGRFRPPHRNLTAAAVAEYVSLRHRLSHYKSEWTGPTGDYIRHDRSLMNYLRARVEAVGGKLGISRKGTRTRKIEEIIGGLSLTDQSVVRTALEEGRYAIRQLQIALESLANIRGIDLSVVKKMSLDELGKQAPFQLSAEEKTTLAAFLARLSNDRFLREMGLVYRNERVKMDYAPGSDLIRPEELRLLFRLAEVNQLS